MKREILWLGLSFLLVAALVLSSCGPTVEGEQEEEEVVVVPPLTMKYDVVVTMPGFPATTTTTWVKKSKMRMEMTVQGITTIVLVDQDAKTSYTYMPAQNTAMKTNYDQAQEPAAAEAASMADYNPKNLGTESINGIVCQVFEYNINGNMAKMWFWKDRGLPVKMEMATTEGKIITEYKNYDFSDIPDSMFELPSGVQIIQ